MDAAPRTAHDAARTPSPRPFRAAWPAPRDAFLRIDFESAARRGDTASLSQRRASFFVERARLRMAQRRYTDAISEAQYAMTLSAHDEAGRRQRSAAYHVIVHSSAHLGAKDATLRATEEWCTLAGSDPDVLRYCSAYLAMVGHHAAAGERARQATALAGSRTAG